MLLPTMSVHLSVSVLFKVTGAKMCVPFGAQTFDIFNLQTSVLVCKYILTMVMVK